MTKIRHIVYRAADPESMAGFFVAALQMEIIQRRPNGAIDLSDGTVNLALLPVRFAGQPPGLEHVGFMVEDEDETCRRLEAAGACRVGATADPYQVKFEGPEGIMVEIGRWPGTEPLSTAR